MTCYLAATRRWITRTKLTPPPPPHAGPSENNAILEDQLKTHRRRQTQTKKTKKRRQTHADLNILRGHAAPPATPSAACRPVSMLRFFFTHFCGTQTHQHSRGHTKGSCRNTKHTLPVLYLFVFYSLSCQHGEDIKQRRAVDKIRSALPHSVNFSSKGKVTPCYRKSNFP